MAKKSNTGIEYKPGSSFMNVKRAQQSLPKTKQNKENKNSCGSIRDVESNNNNKALPRILMFDLETAPIQAYVWGLYQELRTTKMVEKDWYVLSWAAKWYGEDEVFAKCLPDYNNFKKDMEDDAALMGDLWDLMDQADFVVAHNAKKFDVRKMNARFILNGMAPPSPFKTIDTLYEARRSFMFTSNRLGDLCDFLGVKHMKADPGGFETWRGCMRGDPECWERMLEYNKDDVLALEDIYVRLLPYMKQHPSMAPFAGMDHSVCPKCGSDKMKANGKFVCTGVSKFPVYRCGSCGSYARGRTNVLPKENRKALLVNIR